MKKTDDLKSYQSKRDFKKTSEPIGKKSPEKTSELIFVIQKHDASRLHYDFRLEHKGVLKSWAVPKGPSLNPHDKRLAVQVEDHPFDYKDFEGIIPKGEYGGGTVLIWDNGTYELALDESFEAMEKKGHIKLILHGKKLNGGFILQTLRKGEANWLLIKERDKYVDEKHDVTKKDKSVVSDRTLKQIEKDEG